MDKVLFDKNKEKSGDMILNEKHTPSPFSSFCLNPVGIHFQNQEGDEEIVFLVRRHFITNSPWILVSFIALLVPPILGPFLTSLFPFLDLTRTTQLLIVLFYYLIIFAFVLVNFTIWYFNVGFLTNKRVVDVDVHGILSKDISETRITEVVDVSYIQVGAIRHLFNYGDVVIQTEAIELKFEFYRVPHPAQIAKIISDKVRELKGTT